VPVDGEAIPSVDSLLQEAHEAEGLISKFLDFTTPIQYLPERVAIDDLVDEVVASFVVRDRYRQVLFQVEKSAHIELDLDTVLFKQALSNVIDNAADAYENGKGTVLIATSVEDAGLVVTVRDFGRGISPEDGDKIFMPFFSLRPSGTGLGLPLVSKIVDMHGGRIHFDSTVAQGTVFTINIPLDARREPRVDPEILPV
jgi:signal transduction histidine kinase